MASKKKVRKNVAKGIAVVTASFNNTIITITDVNGETLVVKTAGDEVEVAALRTQAMIATTLGDSAK